MALKTKVFRITLLTVVAPFTSANDWQFDPTIRINETYSDNVNYDTGSDKTSSFVNQLGLGLTSYYKSKHTALNIDAEALQATYSHDGDLNDQFLTLDSNVRVKLWSTGLSLVGSASIQNKAVNSYLSPYSDLVSGETTQYQQYSGGLRYNVKNRKYTINSSLIYNTTISEDNLGEQEGYSANLSSKNGSNSDYIFWDVNASYSERNNRGNTARSNTSEIKIGFISPYKFNPFLRLYQEDNSGSVGSGRLAESNSYGLGFRWQLIPRLLVDVSYNFPTDDSPNNQQDDYFDATVNWQPTQRTKLSAGVSQRFYGDSYNFSLSHKSRRFTNTVSYAESIETFTRDSFSVESLGQFLCDDTIAFPSPFNGCISLGNTIPDGFSFREVFDFTIIEDNSFSLNKRLSWVSTLSLRRTTFTVNLSKSDRLNLTDNVETQNNRADFTVTRKISGYSTIDFSTRYSKIANFIGLPTETSNQHRMYKVDYNRDLNKTLSVTVGLSHQNRDSNTALFEYTENRISLEFNKVL